MSQDDIKERLARLEARLEALEHKVDQLVELIASRNHMMKWFTTLLVIVLSFIAALVGIKWALP